MTMAIHPASSSASAQPRWKAIYDQLVAMLPGYTYGSNFFTIAEICEKFDVSLITACLAGVAWLCICSSSSLTTVWLRPASKR